MALKLPPWPDYACARLTRLTYVRFRLDHEKHTAQAINAGPLEAAHSSANGLWVLAQLEPFADVHDFGTVSGLTLRLMGPPFRGAVVYDVVDVPRRRRYTKQRRTRHVDRPATHR